MLGTTIQCDSPIINVYIKNEKKVKKIYIFLYHKKYKKNKLKVIRAKK